MDWLTKHDPPIELHSGSYSKFKVNAEVFYENQSIREAVFDHWFAYLMQFGINDAYFLPIPRGGTTWAEGFKEYYHEHLPKGKPKMPVIIDDVFTTGASIFNMRMDLEKTYGITVPVLVVVNRGFNMRHVCAWMEVQLALSS